MATGVPRRCLNESTAVTPQSCNISSVSRTLAPTVFAVCESVPVVILDPPWSTYQRTIAGPGMLAFGACRIPDVLISKAMF